MERSRSLRLVKERLAELSTDELRHVAGASNDTCPTDLCNPCLFTWSCDNIKTLNCF